MNEQAIKEVDCITQRWLEFGSDQDLRDACGCRPRCSEVGYTYTVTESKWPAPKYYQSFLESEILDRTDRMELKAYTQLWDVMNSVNKTDSSATNYNFIGENFARLNVYLRDLESFYREQQVSYPLSNLFSDIGGTLGLWMGLSLLTLIELFQLMIRLGLVMCGKGTQ